MADQEQAAEIQGPPAPKIDIHTYLPEAINEAKAGNPSKLIEFYSAPGESFLNRLYPDDQPIYQEIIKRTNDEELFSYQRDQARQKAFQNQSAVIDKKLAQNRQHWAEVSALPESEKTNRQLTNILADTENLISLKTGLELYAQPKTVSERFLQDYEDIITAHEEADKNGGVLPEWYKDRKRDAREIQVMKSIINLQSKLKSGFKASAVLEESGIDKEMLKAYDVDKDPTYGNIVTESLNNSVMRFIYANRMVFKAAADLFVPITDDAIAQANAKANELVQGKIAANRRGDVQEVARLNTLINIEKENEQLINTGVGIIGTSKLVIGTPKEIALIDPKFKITWKEVADKLPMFQIGGRVAKYSDIPPVKALTDAIDVDQKGKEEQLTDYLAMAKHAKDLPDEQLPIIERTVTENIPNESGKGSRTITRKVIQPYRQYLKEKIDNISGEITTLNNYKNMLDADVTTVPAFLAELASGEGEIKAGGVILGAAKKGVISMAKPTIKTALKAAEKVGEAKFGKESKFIQHVKFMQDVADGKASVADLPQIANLYNKMFNRYEKLTVGAGPGTMRAEDFEQEVRDLTGARAHLSDQFHREFAENYKEGFPEKKAFTQFANENRDKITLDAKKTGHAAKRYAAKEASGEYLVRQEASAGKAHEYVTQKLEEKGYVIKKSKNIETPFIDNKEKIVHVPENYKPGMNKLGQTMAFGSEYGHVRQRELNTAAHQKMMSTYHDMVLSGSKSGIMKQNPDKRWAFDDDMVEVLFSTGRSEDAEKAMDFVRLRAAHKEALVPYEAEAWELLQQELGTVPGAKDLDFNFPEVAKTIKFNLKHYENMAAEAKNVDNLVSKKKSQLPPAKFASPEENARYIEHKAHSDFLQELRADSYNVEQTMKRLGIEFSEAELKSMANTIEDTEEFVYGHDMLKATGKWEKLTEDLLSNPGYKFSETDKKSTRGVLNLFQKYGYMNREAGVFDMVTMGYNPRVIEETAGILGPVTDQRVGGWAVPNSKLKFATWQENADYYKSVFKNLNNEYLDIQSAYASGTASNVIVAKYRKLVKDTFNLDPDKYTPQLARMDEYIRKGGRTDTDGLTKMWNKYILKPIKIGLTVGHPAFHIRNIVDDSFRTLITSGVAPLRAANLKNAMLAYGGDTTSRIRLSPKISMTPNELAEIAWNHGVLKHTAQSTDSMGSAGSKLIKRYAQTGYKKVARQAWETLPLGPEFSTHENNVLRMSMFTHELQQELKAGKEMKQAIWAARTKVGRALIDNNEAGAMLDFLSTYIPFVRFNAQSFKTYLDVAMQKPEYMYRLNTLLYNHSGSTPTSEERKYMAPYMREQMMLTMGHDKVGNKLYLNRLGLSYEMMNDWLSTEGLGRNMEKLAAQVLPFNLLYGLISERHPFFGTPYNSYFGSKTYKMFYDSELWQKALGGVTRYPDGRDGVGNPIYRYEFDRPERANKILGPGLTLSAAVTYPLMKRFAGESVGAVLTGAMSSRGASEFAKLSDDNKTKLTNWLNYLTGMKFISVDTEMAKLYKEMDKFKATADEMIRAQKDVIKAQDMWSNPEDSAKLEQFYKELGSKYRKRLEDVRKQ